jgi:hypothetical protein
MSGEIPFRLVPGEAAEPRVEWLHHDGGRYHEPFFEQTLVRLRRTAENRGRTLRSTPLSALASPVGPAPTALIFHVSRCGSTLVAQMLGALPRHTVLSEPPLLDALIREWAPAGYGGERHLACLRGAIAALARAQADTVRLFVKLDAWHIFHVPLLRRAFPQTPFVFLHRDPLEVLVSLARLPSLALVRGTLTSAQLGLTDEARDRLSREEYAAAVVGAYFRAAGRHRIELAPVDYRELPSFVWERFPGCVFTAEERARLEGVAGRDAKRPSAVFTSDAREKQLSASPAVRAAAERWCEPAYRAFLAAAPAAAPGA